MTIDKVECLLVRCDGCGQPMDDFADEGVMHFTSMLEVVAHLGGEHEGRVYPGTGRSGGVLLDGGVFWCYACKVLPHRLVPSVLSDEVCARCSRFRDEHATDPAPAVGQGHAELAATIPLRAFGLSGRTSWCVTACARLHRHPLDPDLLEPPDGTRIEFVADTDRYAAWRDDESTVLTGYPADMCWTLYPHDMGHTWACLQRTFGPALGHAITLTPGRPLRPAPNQ